MSSHPKATRTAWIALAVLALPCMITVMDLTVLNLAVPHLSAALKPTSAELLWIIDIYGLLLAGALSTGGTLGDRLGRRKPLLIGAAAFGIASTLAACSPSALLLIILIAQYLPLVLGLSPPQAGLLSLPASLLAMAGPMVSPILVRRFGTASSVAALLTSAALGVGVTRLIGGPAGAVVVAAAYLRERTDPASRAPTERHVVARTPCGECASAQS